MTTRVRSAMTAALALLTTGCLDKSFTILAINDVYRIEGLLPSESGGLARVKTLRDSLAARDGDVLLLHGGDVISPSLLSRLFDGRQMIDILNGLDGANGSFDDNLFVVFGNHEFDADDADDAVVFNELVHGSEFYWVGTNIEFPEVITDNGRRYRVDDTPIVRDTLFRIGGIDVGIFGITLDVPGVAYAAFQDVDSAATVDSLAIDRARRLRQRGAEVVIALTHQDESDDIRILRLEGGPDLVVGGHEHDARVYADTVTTLDGHQQTRYLIRGSSDARTAIEARVTLSTASRFPIVDVAPHELNANTYEQNESLQERIDRWVERHAAIFCEDRTRNCLSDTLAWFTDTLFGEELSIRGGPTNLGSWVAAQLRSVANPGPADPIPTVGLINSGSLRLNQDLAAGDMFTRRHFEELIQYDDPLFSMTVPWETLVEALNRSAACIGDGPWLQVSGVEFDADTAAGHAANVRLPGARPNPDSVRIITTRFLADPGGLDQDGYTMWNRYSPTVWPEPTQLKALLERRLAAASNGATTAVDLPRPTGIALIASSAPRSAC